MRIIHLIVPKGEYTAVQIEANRGTWTVIGAEPVAGPHVAAQCHLDPTDQDLRCVWVTPQGGQVRTHHTADGTVVRRRNR